MPYGDYSKTSHGHGVNSLAGEFRRSQSLVSVNNTLSFQLAAVDIHRGVWSSTAGRLPWTIVTVQSGSALSGYTLHGASSFV